MSGEHAYRIEGRDQTTGRSAAFEVHKTAGDDPGSTILGVVQWVNETYELDLKVKTVGWVDYDG